MYDKLNITENTLRVLALFTKGFNKSYYIREIEKLLHISPRTAQLILDDLEYKNVLESSIRGKIKLFKLKNNFDSRNYLILTEKYKNMCFYQNNILLKEILEKLSYLIKGAGLVFGSYASLTQKKGSDLDIFVIGKYNKKKVENLSKIYAIDINIKHCSLSIFEKNAFKDPLLVEVLKNHVVFVGAELFIQSVLKDEKNSLV